MVSNEEKKSFAFGRQYASAMWSDWEGKFAQRNKKFAELRSYANGTWDMKCVHENIAKNYIKKKFLQYDPNDRQMLFTDLLQAFYNNVDYTQFQPVIRAIDESAVQVKTNRKDRKLDLFYAKDFIQNAAAINGGTSIIPLDQVPQSKEQIELEEQTAKPLRVERGEEKAIQYIAIDNMFSMIQEQVLQDLIEVNIGVSKVETDPIEGIKMYYVKPEEFIHGEKINPFFTDSKYFGQKKEITVAALKNYAAESGIKLTTDDIRRLAKCTEKEEVNDSMVVEVLFYTFKTYFEEVYKKKVNRNTNQISLIDRTKDIGTDREYNPKYASDKSEKVVSNYTVWFDGIMCFDAERTIIRHRPMSNMPEFRGYIIPPYIACSPRKMSFVEKNIQRIKSIQELRFRILHHRNSIRGNITEIDPDAISNITLGKDKLDPKEVLSFYFTMGLAFRKTSDEDGNPSNQNRPLTEIPESIPRALVELTNQYISEIQQLYQAFGAYQNDQQSIDPKTKNPYQPYQFSANTQLRDYTNKLYEFSVRNFQAVSSRINDAFDFPGFKEKLIDNIGIDDVDVMEQFRKDRPKHNFWIYMDYIPTDAERTEFLQALSAHYQNGELDLEDKISLSRMRNILQAVATLRLKLQAKRKEAQDYEMQKSQQMQNGNIAATQAAGEMKLQLEQLTHKNKMERENASFQQQAFLLQKEWEAKLQEASINSQAKFNLEEYRKRYESDLAILKKQMDKATRLEAINESAKQNEQLIKLRRGEINSINETQPEQQVDLSTL